MVFTNKQLTILVPIAILKIGILVYTFYYINNWTNNYWITIIIGLPFNYALNQTIWKTITNLITKISQGSIIEITTKQEDKQQLKKIYGDKA